MMRATRPETVRPGGAVSIDTVPRAYPHPFPFDLVRFGDDALDHQAVLDLGRLMQRADKLFPRVNHFTDECRTAVDPTSTATSGTGPAPVADPDGHIGEPAVGPRNPYAANHGSPNGGALMLRQSGPLGRLRRHYVIGSAEP